MPRPAQQRQARPSDKLDVLNALMLCGSINKEQIARFEGLSSRIFDNRQYRYLLPYYGEAESKRYKRWALAEYLAWRRVPVELRKAGLESNFKRSEALKEHRAQMDTVNIFDDILSDLYSARFAGVPGEDAPRQSVSEEEIESIVLKVLVKKLAGGTKNE